MKELRLDPIVADWLRSGPETGPEHGLKRALAATRKANQRQRWTFPRTWLPEPVAEFQVPRVAVLGLLLVLTLVLLVALAVAFGGRNAVVPTLLKPTEEVIAFSEGGAIYVVNPDGSDRRNLNLSVPNATSPVFSPDGTRIAFLVPTSPDEKGGRLLIASLDGSRPSLIEASHGMQVVPGDVPNFSWSADGERIAFSALNGATAQIFVVDRDGSGLRPITDATAWSDLPSWSPVSKWGDYMGDWIAYRVTEPDTSEVSIERVHPDGIAPELFTGVIGPGSGLSKLTWSSPGNTGILTSYAMNSGFDGATRIVVDGGFGHQVDIWSEGTSGLTDAPIPWSPDSRYLAFISADGNLRLADDDRTTDIYNGQVTSLGPVLGCWVGWSPDSAFLYGGAPNGCKGVVVAPLADPGNSVTLTQSPGVASWRPVPK